jgi:hypothetical protein
MEGNGKTIPLFESLSEGNGMEVWNTHSSLFPPNPKFSFPLKLGGIEGNKFKFNDFFTKRLKMPLVFL